MSSLDDIKKIKDLLDSGVISQAEFEKLKQEILNQGTSFQTSPIKEYNSSAERKKGGKKIFFYLFIVGLLGILALLSSKLFTSTNNLDSLISKKSTIDSIITIKNKSEDYLIYFANSANEFTEAETKYKLPAEAEDIIYLYILNGKVLAAIEGINDGDAGDIYIEETHYFDKNGLTFAASYIENNLAEPSLAHSEITKYFDTEFKQIKVVAIFRDENKKPVNHTYDDSVWNSNDISKNLKAYLDKRNIALSAF
jgi:hypothetical protein